MASPPRARRLLAAVSALLGITVVLTGCGTGGSGSGSDSDELTVWFPGNSQPEIDLVTKTLVPEFEKQNNVKVAVTYVDWTQISPKLAAAFAGNTAPDVFGHGPAAAAGYVDKDRILPLDDQVAAMPAADRTDLGAYLDGGKVNGKQYMVPLSGQGVLLAYRTDLLEQAGVQPPTTWEEARTAGRALTTRTGGQIDRAGLLPQSAKIERVQTFTSLLGSEGGTLLSPDGTAAAFNSEAGVRALDYFGSLFTGDGAVANQLGADFANQPPAQHPLATGKAAMATVTAQQVIQIAKAKPELAGKLGVLQPLSASTAKTYGGAGPGLFVNKDSRHADLAWKFIQYMVSGQVSDKYAETTGAIPVRTSSVSSSYVTAQPLLKPFIQAAPAYVPSPNVASWVQVRDVLDKYIEQALHGTMPAKQALDAAAAEAGPLLAGN